VTGVNPPPDHDPTVALNQVLSEVIDVVQDVKQAHRKVPETHALHRLLDRLFEDLKTWAGLLMDQDQALGVFPLAMMPSVAGRTPPNPWPAAAADEDVRRFLGEHLELLGQHLEAALAAQDEAGSRAVLSEVQRGLRAQRQALSEL
jgi:DNA-binding ferritin-like protein